MALAAQGHQQRRFRRLTVKGNALKYRLTSTTNPRSIMPLRKEELVVLEGKN